MGAIPVSVIVTTKNEERRIGACLAALRRFDDVWVVDSHSADRTGVIARRAGARVVNFRWNGAYPKKRQWCLDHLDLRYERVFFVDADEHVPAALIDEIAGLDWRAAGYFVSGRYEFQGRCLRYGLRNNKLALFDRRRAAFPVVDDLDLPGMGEIEGHYQPVLTGGDAPGRLRTPLIHRAYDDAAGWAARHARYARWEAGMEAKKAWPADPSRCRQWLKLLFRALPLRAAAAFAHCYIFRMGFLDGLAGYRFACSRARYYRMIAAAGKAPGPAAAR